MAKKVVHNTKKQKKKKNTKITIDKAIDNFISAANKPFTVEEVVDTISSLVTRVPKDFAEIIKKKFIDGRLTFFNERNGTYIARHYYFHKAQFLVAPRAEEIEEGILIPGHRFMPFCSPVIFPPQCKIKFTTGKRYLQRKKINWVMENTIIFHTLFGMEQIMRYFEDDNKANIKVLLRDDPFKGEITITAFNVKRVYRDCNFKHGDSFLLTVEDWQRGIFSMEHCPKIRKSISRRKWCHSLEQALESVFQKFGSLTDINEQLAQAFFYGGEKLLTSPSIHIGGFLAQSKQVEITNLGMKTILWKKGESPEDMLLFDMNDVQLKSADNPIDKLLQDLGIPLSKVEVEAYMRDELFKGNRDLQSVFKRCLHDMWNLAAHDRQKERKLYRLLEKLWTQVEKNYNIFTDKYAGKYRANALAIYDEHIKWLHATDPIMLANDELPQKEMVSLSHLMAMLRHLLATLNTGDSFINNAETALPRELAEATLPHTIKEIAMTSQVLRDAIDYKLQATTQMSVVEKKTPKSRKKTSKLRSTSRPKEQVIYQLKITLLGTNPKIWRRVQVAENTTLAHLHLVVQDAMGWENYHLHEFDIAGTKYGPPAEDYYDNFAENEENVVLSEVICGPGERFYYEYDFGDAWEHEILVEKMFPSEKNKKYPLCLDGEYACPPEDCGGIIGFYHLLEITKNPKHPEYQEMLEWLGKPFQHRALDLQAINKKLR